MKKILFSLLLLIALFLTACVNTESDVDSPNDDNDEEVAQTPSERPTISLLAMSSAEDDANILWSQLTDAGFDVELNIQPDFGSFRAQRDAFNYDLALTSWTTVTGNPDYAVRSLFTSDGDNSLFSDDVADELIDLASTQLPGDYEDTYRQLEERIVFEQAYIAPLYTSYKAQGVNHDIIDESTVRLPKSRAAVWEIIDYVDSDQRSTQPLLMQQAIGNLTSLDPIKGNDGSINTLNTNVYVRLVNLSDDDEVISDGSLSRNHVIGDGNSEYYFVLRDDIQFAQVADGEVVNSNERVGAEDVKFSLDRARDRDSVPDHRTYSLHESMAAVDIIDDLSSLENVEDTEGNSILESLNDGLDAEITSLTSDKNEADNASGVYQVVRITTHEPFPQVLNYLAHQSGGIVSEQQVQAVNTFSNEDYDPDTDIAYGDQRTVTENSEHENTLFASGPYILVSKNDYEARFVKNPGYMPGTDFEPRIEEVTVRFIEDSESALSALRNGEIHILNGVSETRYDTVRDHESLTLQQNESNGVTYLSINSQEGIFSDNPELRKAVLYTIDQESFITFYQGHKMPAVSTLSPLVDTGLSHEADLDRGQAYLREATE